MKKLIILVLLFISVLSINHNAQGMELPKEGNVEFLTAIDLDSKEVILKEQQFVLHVKINKLVGGEIESTLGSGIPISYYSVTILKSIKGSLNVKEIKIAQFGGLDEFASIISTSNFSLLKENKEYVINGNLVSTNSVSNIDKGTIILPIYNGYEEVSEDSKIVEEYEKVSNSNNDVGIQGIQCPDGPCENPETDPLQGTSFSNPYVVNKTSSFSTHISRNEEIIFKIYTNDGLVNYDFSTSTTPGKSVTDTIGHLYYSSQIEIQSDDDSGDSTNFYMHRLISGAENYFYLKVIGYSDTTSGYTDININYGACDCINNPGDLLLNYNSFDGNGNINYEFNTKYEDELIYSINEWNSVDRTIFIEDTIGTVNDLYISDVYDDTKTYIGRYTNRGPLEDTIVLNDYYMLDYNIIQRRFVILHELGHALGLDHMTSAQNEKISTSEPDLNVMNGVLANYDKLGVCDKSLFIYSLYRVEL